MDIMKKNKGLYILLLIVLLVVVIVSLIYPEEGGNFISIAFTYGWQILLIMPPVLILMGLMQVWIPKELIQKYIGSQSGVKGKILCILFGILPTGPMYVFLPIASGLLKKGASVSNIIILLGIMSSEKIPQMLVEINFLGLRFALTRFILTVIAVIIMGGMIEKLVVNPIKSQP
jgi:uncharacterized membrane protein YraQ (UPF0718 family)